MATKILHIITKLEFGGAQGNTLYTVAHLDRKRFEPYLAAGAGGMLDKTSQQEILYITSLKREISPLKDLIATLELRALIKKLKPALVHTHSSKAGILGRIAAWLAGAPVLVHTFHGFGFHEGQNPLEKYVYICAEKLCALFSDALIFVSGANMDYARGYNLGSENQYFLIRSGIPLNNYPAKIDKSAKRAELGVPQDAILVVSLGNFKPQKNPEHFINAAKRLTGSHSNTVFMFVGGGEGLKEARIRAKEAGLEKRLLFPGWREDSAEILAAADIFTLTSLWEGLPRSLVEAIKTGLPSVCYKTDGVMDLLNDTVNGFEIEQGDIDNFCVKLKELIDNPALRRQMAEKAAATDLTEFEIDYMVRQQEELYTSLLKEKQYDS